jgi:hypothetical protein
MKNTDQFLNRIFKISRRNPDPIPSELPFGLETAVLAHWRASSRGRANGGTVRAMRWAALVACAVALLSAICQRDELAQFSRRSDPQTRIADSALAAGFDYE